MRIIDLLVQGPRGNEKVKGSLKGLLGIVKDRIKAIPAGGPQSTGRIHETGKGHGHDLVGSRGQGHLIHLICVRIVQILIVPDAAAKTTDTTEIGLYVGTPLPLGPARTAQL